jgi:hypothetical protein
MLENPFERPFEGKALESFVRFSVQVGFKTRHAGQRWVISPPKLQKDVENPP